MERFNDPEDFFREIACVVYYELIACFYMDQLRLKKYAN